MFNFDMIQPVVLLLFYCVFLYCFCNLSLWSKVLQLSKYKIWFV